MKKDEENNIYGLAHNDEVFSRYFQIAEKVDALIRVESIDKKQAQKNFSQITIPDFSLHESHDMSNVKNVTKNLNNIKKYKKYCNLIRFFNNKASKYDRFINSRYS